MVLRVEGRNGTLGHTFATLLGPFRKIPHFLGFNNIFKAFCCHESIWIMYTGCREIKTFWLLNVSRIVLGILPSAIRVDDVAVNVDNLISSCEYSAEEVKGGM